MSLTAPDLTIDVTTNTTCNGLLFTDETVYATNPAVGILSSQVTSATINLQYSTLGTYIEYVFTISSNVITAATLSLAGATPVNIFSQLTSTVFPFTDFNLSQAWTNITIPNVEDGVYYTTYTISGTGGDGSPFTYDTTQEILVSCSLCCCIAKKFQSLSVDCACDDKKWMIAMRARSYQYAAQFSADVGDVDNAVAALNLATKICNGSGGCGCS